jgi:plasmid stabilization system protein ParE
MVSDLYTSAYEGMTRAYAIANDLENAKKYINLARKALESIVDKEDRRIYTDQIDETEVMIDQLRSRFERAVDH